MVAHAIPPPADREGHEVGNARRHVLATGPDGQVAAMEVAPGDTQTTGPPVTSAGTDRTCVLVRTGCSDAGIFSLEPSGSWTAVDTGLADGMRPRTVVVTAGEGAMAGSWMRRGDLGFLDMAIATLP